MSIMSSDTEITYLTVFLKRLATPYFLETQEEGSQIKTSLLPISLIFSIQDRRRSLSITKEEMKRTENGEIISSEKNEGCCFSSGPERVLVWKASSQLSRKYEVECHLRNGAIIFSNFEFLEYVPMLCRYYLF